LIKIIKLHFDDSNTITLNTQYAVIK